MSRNVFIESGIYNHGVNSAEVLRRELAKVKNPKFHWDEDGNLFIDEDFDMRHIEAILRARDMAWEEVHSPDFIAKQKVLNAFKILLTEWIERPGIDPTSYDRIPVIDIIKQVTALDLGKEVKKCQKQLKEK